jgi:hypothetical protein
VWCCGEQKQTRLDVQRRREDMSQRRTMESYQCIWKLEFGQQQKSRNGTVQKSRPNADMTELASTFP